MSLRGRGEELGHGGEPAWGCRRWWGGEGAVRGERRPRKGGIPGTSAGSLGDLGQVVSPLGARFAASPARSGVGEGTASFPGREPARRGARQVRNGCDRPGGTGCWRATGMPGMLGPAAACRVRCSVRNAGVRHSAPAGTGRDAPREC